MLNNIRSKMVDLRSDGFESHSTRQLIRITQELSWDIVNSTRASKDVSLSLYRCYLR